MLSTAIDVANGSVAERRADIRRMLVERRRELLNEIQSRVRDVREEDPASTTTPHNWANCSTPSPRKIWRLRSFR